MKRILTILLTALLICFLSACSVKLPALPRSRTDTPLLQGTPAQLREKWQLLFFEGAEGMNAAGERIYLAFYSRSDLRAAALMIVSADSAVLRMYEIGEVVMEDGHLVIVDVEHGNKLPFDVTVKEVLGGFEIRFMDGDTADMYYVSQGTILDHMTAIAEKFAE